MSLKAYHHKRNFKKTSEPKGKINSSPTKNLYVIQKHAASHLHYDFRLELDGVLKSWAIPKGPCLDPKIKRLAIAVEDHPLEYGSFEGIIPEGEYGAGAVMLWDSGYWTTEQNAKTSYDKGHLVFQLHGKKLKGLWALIRFKKEQKSWFLIKLEDRYSESLAHYDVTVKKPKSVKSNKIIEDIQKQYQQIWNKKKVKIDLSIKGEKSSMPRVIRPQLSTLVDQPPSGNDWLHEIKFDGYRLIAFLNNKTVTLMTRGHQDWTHLFSDIAKKLKNLPVKNAVFDGEIVVLDENQRPNFQLLQNSIKGNKIKNLIYYIFDLIYLNGYSLSEIPLLERKKLLHKIIPAKAEGNLRYSDHIIGSGKEFFKTSCEMKFEGIISKKIDSPYIQKRTKYWLKSKCGRRQEFIIGGYTRSKARNFFGSLLIGYFDKTKKKLIYAGHVGTGFDDKTLSSTYALLKKYQVDENPFSQKPQNIKDVNWVKPVILVEVEFIDMTKDGMLRHPSFKGLRIDKTAKKVVLENPISVKKTLSKSKEKINKINLKITNPNKILYPEARISKQDLVMYYYHIRKWILPYIKNRPLMILRCPDGYQKGCFHQKHINKYSSKELHYIPIEEKGKIEKTIYIDDAQGLLTLAQMATLEIHPWGSMISHVENPDYIVFDLDPAINVSWRQVIKAAFLVREELKKIKLKSFVKTTGGKGLHISVPIKPEFNWGQIKNFSHLFVQYMVMQYPQIFIGSLSKVKRNKKIFLDYLRNQKNATAIAPYSTRAKSNATVSTPIDWNELTNDKRSTTYTIKTIFQRLDNLKKDPWHDFFRIKQSLKHALKVT